MQSSSMPRRGSHGVRVEDYPAPFIVQAPIELPPAATSFAAGTPTTKESSRRKLFAAAGEDAGMSLITTNRFKPMFERTTGAKADAPAAQAQEVQNSAKIPQTAEVKSHLTDWKQPSDLGQAPPGVTASTVRIMPPITSRNPSVAHRTADRIPYNSQTLNQTSRSSPRQVHPSSAGLQPQLATESAAAKAHPPTAFARPSSAGRTRP
eukprot:145360-Pyramimonas_sp.AAC.1